MSSPGRAGRAGSTGGRRRVWPLVLVVAFVVLPIVEIWVILRVGSLIGGWSTLALLVLDSLVGAWLVRREGARTWRALQEALQRGTMPGRELADGALVLIGGTLMLTPGFVSDVLGIVLVLPLTRPLARGLLLSAIARRTSVPVGPRGTRPTGPDGYPGRGQGPRPDQRPAGPVVQGEVLDEE